MDVKINRGAPTPQMPPKAAQKNVGGAPFASLLQAAGERGEAANAKSAEFAAQSPDEVFAAALKGGASPDLDKLDRYLEWRIGQETQK